MRPDVGFELGEVVHRALAVRRGDDMDRVLPEVLRNLAPCGLDGGDGVGEGTVLEISNMSAMGRELLKAIGTCHVKEDGIGVERCLNVG